MVDDPNRKTPRQFQCRDYLWDAFEQLSGELECSIDYLINESMRHYLRAQGRYSTTRNPSVNGFGQATGAEPPQGFRSTTVPPMTTRPTSPPTGRQQQVPIGPPPRLPTPPSGGPQRTVPPMPPAAPRMSAPPAPPPRVSSSAAPAALYAMCEGQEVPVTKEEFIIGRGQKICDLVIRDTNISRQHARVVLHNGQYWMIDFNSTNGVEFRGAKIQQKRVENGDVFSICGHDIQFVYR